MAETLKLISIIGALVTLLTGSYQLHLLKLVKRTPKQQNLYLVTCVLMVSMLLAGINSLFITAWTVLAATHVIYFLVKTQKYGNYSREPDQRARSRQKQYLS